MTVTWTQALRDAAQALIDEPTPADKDWRAQSDEDVRSRAREYVAIPVGTVFQPFQLEYTECLIQRLDLDWDNPRPSHTTFRNLWATALTFAEDHTVGESRGIKRSHRAEGRNFVD